MRSDENTLHYFHIDTYVLRRKLPLNQLKEIILKMEE
jgi:hypothetical protein